VRRLRRCSCFLYLRQSQPRVRRPPSVVAVDSRGPLQKQLDDADLLLSGHGSRP
jgi:hypothetical protein